MLTDFHRYADTDCRPASDRFLRRFNTKKRKAFLATLCLTVFLFPLGTNTGSIKMHYLTPIVIAVIFLLLKAIAGAGRKFRWVYCSPPFCSCR